jgi:hypothetical protein
VLYAYQVAAAVEAERAATTTVDTVVAAEEQRSVQWEVEITATLASRQAQCR